MGSIRRFGLALALAGMIAGGVTVGLEAAGKKKTTTTTTTDGLAATCAYLTAVMSYEYVSPYIYVYAASLYNQYGCASLTTQ